MQVEFESCRMSYNKQEDTIQHFVSGTVTQTYAWYSIQIWVLEKLKQEQKRTYSLCFPGVQTNYQEAHTAKSTSLQAN